MTASWPPAADREEARGPQAFTPKRDRSVSRALQVYARFAASADLGAVRLLD